MRYTADTLALYNDLFKDAHAAFIKESRVGPVRRVLSRWLNPETEKAMMDAVEQSARQEAALGHAATAHEAAKMENALNLSRAERYAKELETLKHRPGTVTEAQALAQKAQTGRNVALGVGALGVGAGVPLAYTAGRQKGEQGKTQLRNIAFGAGTAAGLTAPTVIRGLGTIARSAGQTGAFPELTDIYPGYGY